MSGESLLFHGAVSLGENEGVGGWMEACRVTALNDPEVCTSEWFRW